MQQNGSGDGSSAPESDWRLVLLATLAVFAVYAASTWTRTLPIVAWDELGFISQAQFLAGGPTAINMGTGPYYHAGYALLLVPVWWITHDPLLAYKGFMLINAVLAALLVPLLVGLGEAFGFRRSPLIVLAAALVAMWPSNFFVSHYAWSEALFRLAFAAHIWLLARLALRPDKRWAVLFGLSAALPYAVHPKALLILLLAPTALLLLRMMRVLDTRTVIVALIPFAVITVGEMLAMGYLHEVLWDEQAYSASQTLLGRVLRPDAMFSGLVVILGQLWYQLAASLGLAGLGLWFALRSMVGRGTPAFRLVSGYLVAAVLAVALASVVQMLDPERVDQVAYGRYIDGASVVLVWLGLCWLVFGARGEGQRLVGLGAIGSVLVAGGLLASLQFMEHLEPAHPEAVAGIGWIFRTGSTPLQFFGINSVIAAVLAGLLLLLNRTGRLVVVAVFGIGASIVISAYLTAQSRAQLEILSADASEIRGAALQPLYWTDEVRDRNLWSYHLQYVLGATFLERDGALPAGAGLVSGEPGGAGLVCAAKLSNGLFLLASAPHPAGC